MTTLDVRHLGLHELSDPEAPIDRLAGGLGFTDLA
jgi:hypothetical protein